jgi:hypothetical protein
MQEDINLPEVDKRANTPEWLKRLQDNSWEPEIFISGILLAFIFTVPTHVYQFAVKLIQDSGFSYFGAYLVLIYTAATINVFKIFFITHLTLRFFWAGLLGLSYAYPEGVNKSKLFNIAKSFDYIKPIDMVLRIEKLCSSTFAYPSFVGIYGVVFAGYLILLLFIQLWLKLSFLYVYVMFMASLLLFALLMLVGKNNRIRKWFGSSMTSSISAIYQSNMGKWTTMGYTFIILALAIPGISGDINNFMLFLNNSNLNSEELKWSHKEYFYTENREADIRFPRTNIPSEIVEKNYLPLSVAHYEEDELSMPNFSITYAKSLDTLNWQHVKNPTDLYRVYINDSLFSTTKWVPTMYEESNQKAYSTLIDISTLPEGYHTVRVEKLLESLFPFAYKYTPDIRLRKNWSKFNFIKIKS